MSAVLAVVLARGGSKGLPKKNTRQIAGKPCVAWTIEAALASARVDRVLVSSDDPGVLEIASALGAETHERSSETAGDTATVDAAAREAVGDTDADPIVILYGNVPVRPEGLIDEAVGLLLESGCDSVQSYAPVGKHHPWWTARLDGSGEVRPWEGDVLNHGVFRRQDLPEAYIPDGGVIVVTRRALMLEIRGVPEGPHAFFGLSRRGVRTEEGAVIDIDNAVDLRVAEATLLERAR